MEVQKPCKETPSIGLGYADCKRRTQHEIELKKSKCFVEYLNRGLRKVTRLKSGRLRGTLLVWNTDFLSTTSLPNISRGSPIVRQWIPSRPFPLDRYRGTDID